jgi:hypothetical protein
MAGRDVFWDEHSSDSGAYVGESASESPKDQPYGSDTYPGGSRGPYHRDKAEMAGRGVYPPQRTL